MQRTFFEKGNITRWQWFWSRLAVVEGTIWIVHVCLGWIPIVITGCKYNTGDNLPMAIVLYILFGIGGILAMWTSLVFGGLTIPGHTDPWDN